MNLFKRLLWRSAILMLSCTCSYFAWNILIRSVDQSAQQTWNHVNFDLCGEISFPATIGSSGLVLERLVSYEGPFLEDKSNDEVTDVACLIIRNQGTQTVSYVKIQLSGNEDFYLFEAWDIPHGEAVVVLDRNKAHYKKPNITSATASVLFCTASTRDAEVDIIGQGMGEVFITNLSERIMDDLVLYHKGYDPTSSLYLGGVTHLTKCPTIEPGETIIVMPEHYANGYSRILWVRSEADAAVSA